MLKVIYGCLFLIYIAGVSLDLDYIALMGLVVGLRGVLNSLKLLIVKYQMNVWLDGVHV